MNSIYKLFLDFGGECYWCGESVTTENATRDHLIPKRRGTSAARPNIVLSCSGCNHERGSRDAVEFARMKRRNVADVRRRITQAEAFFAATGRVVL